MKTNPNRKSMKMEADELTEKIDPAATPKPRKPAACRLASVFSRWPQENPVAPG